MTVLSGAIEKYTRAIQWAFMDQAGCPQGKVILRDVFELNKNRQLTVGR